MSIGIKISKPGVDVSDATISELSLSDNNTSIKCSGVQHTTVTLTVGEFINEGSVIVTHDLGFVPFVLAFLVVSGAYYQIPMSSGVFYTDAWIKVTATNFTITVNSIDLAGTYDIYYYLSGGDAIV